MDWVGGCQGFADAGAADEIELVGALEGADGLSAVDGAVGGGGAVVVDAVGGRGAVVVNAFKGRQSFTPSHVRTRPRSAATTMPTNQWGSLRPLREPVVMAC